MGQVDPKWDLVSSRASIIEKRYNEESPYTDDDMHHLDWNGSAIMSGNGTERFD